jgi:hypothetical protein
VYINAYNSEKTTKRRSHSIGKSALWVPVCSLISFHMISHLAGKPHGPSLSFSVFSGTGVVAVCCGGAVVGALVPFSVALCVVPITGFAFSPSSSHGCALATAS